MTKLENFVGMMTGHFDNKDQFDKMQEEGKTYPYAEHINTICNDRRYRSRCQMLRGSERYPRRRQH